ncbi:hypothetical protein D3C81_1197240 [compost metagenome]
MPAAETLEQPDKVSEKRLAELIGTTPTALRRRREKKLIPHGVWSKIDGRIMYSIRRYDAWLESLWTGQPVLSRSARRSESASHGKVQPLPAAVKPLPIRKPRRGSSRPSICVLR